MTPSSPSPNTGPTTGARKSGAQTRKQAATWITPKQIERTRDACLTDTFPTYLQGRNETIITLLADTGLRVSKLVALGALLETAWEEELRWTGVKIDAYLDVEPETARQLRRYRTNAWNATEAVFPSRQSNRVSKASVRRLVKKAAEVADVNPYVAGSGRGDSTTVSPHTFRHSITFQMNRQEDNCLEAVML